MTLTPADTDNLRMLTRFECQSVSLHTTIVPQMRSLIQRRLVEIDAGRTARQQGDGFSRELYRITERGLDALKGYGAE